jgi:hypothetical protein
VFVNISRPIHSLICVSHPVLTKRRTARTSHYIHWRTSSLHPACLLQEAAFCSLRCCRAGITMKWVVFLLLFHRIHSRTGSSRLWHRYCPCRCSGKTG